MATPIHGPDGTQLGWAITDDEAAEVLARTEANDQLRATRELGPMTVGTSWSDGLHDLTFTGPEAIPCERCGHPLPPMTVEMLSQVRTLGVAAVHEVCPTDPPAVPEGRYFEVRVQVLEVVEHDEGDGDTGVRELRHEVVEFFRFERGVRAPTLEDAMRPLAAALGERWLEAEKHARIADQP